MKSKFLFILITILSLSCKQEKQIAVNQSIIIEVPEATIQEKEKPIKVYYKNNNRPNIGVYQTKSLDKDLVVSSTEIVNPQKKYTDSNNLAFLKIKTPIALFNSINDLGENKAIGLLKESSIIEVDTIFYKNVYRDTTKAWSLTHNVWYAIKINGSPFYTDFKIHDFIALKKDLKNLNQKLLVVAQNTGYDENHDIGYPNYFFLSFLNEKDQIIYQSDILNFDFGDEFWDEFYNIKIIEKENTVTISMNNDSGNSNPRYKTVWTGNELKRLNIK